ncbi:hypothetical protein KPL76_05855 [Subtercola sp. PAMC28395]|uniref:rhamnosyltransferase WsaF family glycosyltransferase n=1 Tax=Subtercola sp. PAMC28395 TaxID=2846775 RepID=UPI001C0DC7C9|nr:hypothetical protein [Subtercola sp. PAMC28395]QWT24882.1 hypothetical protein KPL76_05855 [Subtercola sp. PAMC28395]
MTVLGKVQAGLNRKRYLQRSAELSQRTVEHMPKALRYQGLHAESLSLVGLLSVAEPSVNLLLPELRRDGLFAGIKTALEVGVAVALSRGVKLRLVVMNAPPSKSDIEYLCGKLAAEFGISISRIEVVPIHEMKNSGFSESDVWIATYWTTAHALDVAARLQLIDRRRVIYLIQDYEPLFLPASTDSALASATYHAGFVSLVNSTPLRAFLKERESLQVDAARTFAPRLDHKLLEKAALERESMSGSLRILFYGRPSKPRNMFNLGVSALRSVAPELVKSGCHVTFRSIGETHRDIELSDGAVLRSVGKVSWGEYFKVLASADVLLSLQASPHPSHPPLDAVASGGRSVTNEVAGTRAHLHPRLFAVNPDPDELCGAILEARSQHEADRRASGFDDAFMSSLGVNFDSAIASTVDQIGAS